MRSRLSINKYGLDIKVCQLGRRYISKVINAVGDDGIWNVYFGPLKLGRLLERYMRIEDEYGKLKRK